MTHPARRPGAASVGPGRGGRTVPAGATSLLLALALAGVAAPARAQDDLPQLTAPVNDFAGVIDGESARQLDTLIRSLQQASGDVVVVATVKTFAPYGDIREYAVKMFENRGKGIGQGGKDNGLLVLLAVDDRAVWTEVGYDLEGFVTDGFAGETARQFMVPEFRNGQYGRGLLAGTSRLIGRIAEARQVTLQGVQPVSRRPRVNVNTGSSLSTALFVLFIIIMLLSRGGGGGGRRRGWHSGVGPFGGGFGGGLGGGCGGGFGGLGGGGGFGGGFGGFGGGRSGGGGGGASW